MPIDMPAAEVQLDVEDVRSLIRAQFPDLGMRPLTLLANGWDNTLLRLGADLLVRLPRRQAAAQLVAHEQRWLPRLAPGLPLPVPVPLRLGRPGSGFPWPWSITAYVPGTDAGNVAELDTAATAVTLGGFLASLHRPAPPDAPVNRVRGVPLRLRDDSFNANLALAGDLIDAAAARDVWRAALDAAPWEQHPLWLHGDLHPANLLVRDARLAAVIDFGDITAGDPATDLAVAWMILPASDRAAFWAAYATGAGHAVDTDLHLRTRGWAVAFAAVYLAHSADNPTMRRIGLRTAAAVLEPGPRLR